MLALLTADMRVTEWYQQERKRPLGQPTEMVRVREGNAGLQLKIDDSGKNDLEMCLAYGCIPSTAGH